MEKKIAVIAGGWSGLIVCDEIKKKHSDYEITFVHDKKSSVQWGTEFKEELFFDQFYSFLKINHPVMVEWIKKYGSELAYVEADSKLKYQTVKDSMVYKVPITKSQFLWNSILFFPLNLKILFSLRKSYAIWPGISVFDAARNIFGESFTDYFASIFSRAILGNDGKDMEFSSSFPGFYEVFTKNGKLESSYIEFVNQLESKYPVLSNSSLYKNRKTIQFKKGTGQIFQKMLAALRKSGMQYFETNVKSIQTTEMGYELKTEKTSLGHFNDVILCSSPSKAAQQISKLSKEASEQLEKNKITPMSTVYHIWDSKDFKGSSAGLIFPRKEKSKIYGSQFLSNLFSENYSDDITVVRSFIPGDSSLFSDRDLSDMVIHSYKRLYRNVPNPKDFYVYRYTEGIPRYAPGFRDSLEEVKTLLPETIHFAGWYYSGFLLMDQIEQAASIASRL